MNDYSSSVKKKSADFSVRNVLHDRLNPLHPNISMHSLHTVLWTLPRVLTRKICLTILELFQKKKYPQFTSVQCLYPQFKYVIFIYSRLFIHHFTGLFGTNIKTSSQLACQLSRQSNAPVSQGSWVQIPYKPTIFFRPCFHSCSSTVHYREGRFHIHVFIRSSHMRFLYIFTVIYHYHYEEPRVPILCS